MIDWTFLIPLDFESVLRPVSVTCHIDKSLVFTVNYFAFHRQF